jgi:signal transduction histidine kinase
MSLAKTKDSSEYLLSRYLKFIEISRELSFTLDTKTLLQSIVDAACSLTDSKSDSFLLFDERQNELYFEATTDNASPSLMGMAITVEGSVAGDVIKSRKPILENNLIDNPKQFKFRIDDIQQNSNNLIGIPLITQDKIVGVLESINKASGDYTNEDIEILSALGSQAAVAIINARLFQQSDLIAEMVHEIRTPLASINAASHLLTRPSLSTKQRVDMGETIQKETNLLAELATSFLDLARLESGREKYEQEPIQLNSLIKESVEIMGSRIKEQNLTLIQTIDESVPIFIGDEDKLKQVILNLISNAIKYNVPNGKIYIKSGYDEIAQSINFSIEDTGLGIHKEHQKLLFEKFYRIPNSDIIAKGSGLGLAISKKIINAHNGNLLVSSELGKGSIFSVSIPTTK